MAEYIEREALKKKIDNACDECRQSCLEFDGIFADCSQCILQDIQSIPAADVRPVVHGHWFISECEYLDCSICGTSHYTGCESTKEAQKYLDSGYAPSFCPGCGSDMRGTGKEDKAKESNSKKQCPVCGRENCFVCAYCGADMRGDNDV